jgi:hypothetical protein
VPGRGRRRGTSPRPTRRNEAIAEWIVDGAPALDLAEISPARFAGLDLDETELRERCRHPYATNYRAGGETSTAS